jgi:2'-5' RNA ligase
MHLTLRFIGDADERRARALAAALERPLPVAPFDLTVAGVGTFPPRGRPRVIWVGVANGRETIVAIEREIAGRVDAIAGASEERGFTPHLTVARIKDAAGLNRTICDGLEDRLLGSTRVGEVVLYESRLSSAGPAYVPLRRTALGGEP